jgi:glycosyltransferase involved in cell wall biosynthesis
MACGTPVVTSDVSALRDLAQGAAVLIDPTNIDALAEAMRRLLKNPTEASKLRERGVSRAKLYTWSEAARLTIEAYEAALR